MIFHSEEAVSDYWDPILNPLDYNYVIVSNDDDAFFAMGLLYYGNIHQIPSFELQNAMFYLNNFEKKAGFVDGLNVSYELKEYLHWTRVTGALTEYVYYKNKEISNWNFVSYYIFQHESLWRHFPSLRDSFFLIRNLMSYKDGIREFIKYRDMSIDDGTMFEELEIL